MENVSSPPVVSVLMPVYNHAPYLRDAVASVLGQTYTNFELIVIDDASSDNSWEILQSFSDSRICLHKHEINQGSHLTLNECLRQANGQFIAIINSDDVFIPSRLETCLRVLQDEQADLVGTDITLIDTYGNAISEHWWIQAFSVLKDVWHTTGDWIATLACGNVFMTTSNFVFRRSWFESVGGFADFQYVLDYEWLIRGCSIGKKLAWINTPLLNYRLHERNTISQSPLAANIECSAMLRQSLPSFLAQNDLDKERMRQISVQWARIERYIIEIKDDLMHQALVRKENELLPIISNNEQLIAKQKQWIADRDHIIEDQNNWLTERDRIIEDQQKLVAERDQIIADRDTLLAAIRIEMDDFKRTVETSISFRLGRAITFPVRYLMNIFKTQQGNT